MLVENYNINSFRTPTVTISSIDEDSANATWTSVTGATSYRYELRRDSSLGTIVSSGTIFNRSRSLTGLDDNTRYVFRVRAESTNSIYEDTGSYFNRTFTTDEEVVVPRISTIDTISIDSLLSNGIAEISWTYSGSTSFFSSFQWSLRRLGFGAIIRNGNNVLSDLDVSITGLTVGVGYQFSMVVISSNTSIFRHSLNVSQSFIFIVTNEEETLTLESPTSRSHLTTTSSITYRWNTVTSDTNGNSLSGANVRYVVRVGGSVVQRNSNSTYTRSGLSEDTTYSITVVAEDTNDVYNDSSGVTLSATTDEEEEEETLTLESPTSRSHLTTTSSITYRWNTVTSDTNGNSLSGANVRYVVRVGGSVVQRNSNSTYTRSGLSEDTTYSITVVAEDTNDVYNDSSGVTLSATTDEEEILTLESPTSRSHLTTTSSITYRWNTVTTDTNGNSLSGANVRYVVRVGGSVVQRNSNSTYTRSGLSEDTTYSITVVAEDTNDVYNDSSGVTLSATTIGALDAPDVSLFNNTYPTHNSVRFNWDNIDNTNRYRYTIREGGVTGDELSGYPRTTFSSSTPILSGLERETSYTFQVRAEPSNSQLFLPSSYTNFSFTTIKERLARPNRPTATFTSRDVTVRYSNINNANDYLVEIIQTDDDDNITIIVSETIPDENNIFSVIFVDDLLPGMSYSARVTALADDDSGFADSLPSPLRNFTSRTENLPTLTVTEVDLDSFSETATIRWEITSDNIASFRVLVEYTNGVDVYDSDTDSSRTIGINDRVLVLNYRDDLISGTYRVTVTANGNFGYTSVNDRFDSNFTIRYPLLVPQV